MPQLESVKNHYAKFMISSERANARFSFFQLRSLVGEIFILLSSSFSDVCQMSSIGESSPISLYSILQQWHCGGYSEFNIFECYCLMHATILICLHYVPKWSKVCQSSSIKNSHRMLVNIQPNKVWPHHLMTMLAKLELDIRYKQITTMISPIYFKRMSCSIMIYFRLRKDCTEC